MARRARLMSEMVNDSPWSRCARAPVARAVTNGCTCAATTGNAWASGSGGRTAAASTEDRTTSAIAPAGSAAANRLSDSTNASSEPYGGRSSVPSARATASLSPLGTRNSLVRGREEESRGAARRGRQAGRRRRRGLLWKRCRWKKVARRAPRARPRSDRAPPATRPHERSSRLRYGRSRTPAAARSARETGPLGLGIAPDELRQPCHQERPSKNGRKAARILKDATRLLVNG